MTKAVLEDVFTSLKSEVRAELLHEIEPKIELLQSLGDEIIAQLGGHHEPRKVAKKQAAPAITATPARTKLSRKGALQAMIRSVLVAHDREPMSIFEIRDELLKKPLYHDHDPQQLYTMVSQRIGQMEGLKVVKNKYQVAGQTTSGWSRKRPPLSSWQPLAIPFTNSTETE